MRTCHVLVYATLVVTVWSGVPYVLGLKRMMTMRREAST
jgi:hypothetical protein